MMLTVNPARPATDKIDALRGFTGQGSLNFATARTVLDFWRLDFSQCVTDKPICSFE